MLPMATTSDSYNIILQSDLIRSREGEGEGEGEGERERWREGGSLGREVLSC